jgi:hypothetical protein
MQTRTMWLGVVPIVALALVLLAQAAVWLAIVLGILAAALGLGYGALRLGWRGFLVVYAGVLDARERRAEVAHVEAEADLKREEVEAAKARRHLIPGEFIGAQLSQPGQYHIWGNGQVKVTPVEEEAPSVLPALPRAEPFAAIVQSIRPGHLVLGYNLAGAIAGDISDLLSTAIIGRPGTKLHHSLPALPHKP